MSHAAQLFQPLPQAPSAAVPAGITPEGAARGVWLPNAFLWVAIWRLLVVAQGAASLLLVRGGEQPELGLVAAGTLIAALTMVVARWRPVGRLHRIVLGVDMCACVGLLALANTATSMAFVALFSYSIVVLWAAERPIDAWIAGGLGALAYGVLGLGGPFATADRDIFVIYLSLYLFFALAVSGFFTIARRIAALEVATEITRERGRYRRDLHDRLGQALCGLHFELQAVRSGGVDEGAAQRLHSLADGYRDAGVMLADLFRQSEEPLVATNVVSLIQQEARRLSSHSRVAIDVTSEGEPSRIPPWVRPHVWSVAGECMTNALKHGEASQISIELSIGPDSLVLSVTDDGVGFDCPAGSLPEKIGHYGLREMTERARICGGEVAVASQPGFGTRVRFSAPLPANSHEDIIERDAGKLRSNVEQLVLLLRAALGAVAVMQFVLYTTGASGQALLLGSLFTIGCIVDLVLPLRQGRRLYSSARALHSLTVLYAGAYSVCLVTSTPTYFLLYAPLVLLLSGVHGGRESATGMTVTMSAMIAAAHMVATAAGFDADPRVTLMFIANIVIIGMSAAQGARLLDRLEWLQIRVRYQAVARLRQGLSTRMRDELIEQLDALERTTRSMSEQELTQHRFDEVAKELEDGSTAVKGRLRTIVHQLADPPSTRENRHG